MSIMAKTPSGYKKIGSAYLGEQPVDKVFNANGDVVYALQRELTGVPPLLFKGKEQSELLNYRIYGDTVDGESVGDRTGNLFDGEFLQGYWADVNGLFIVSNNWISTKKIPCKSNAQYTFSSSFLSRWAGFFWYDENDNYLSNNTAYNITLLTKTSPSNAAYMAIDIAGYPALDNAISPSDVTDFMLVEGSTPLPYEPYGYKVPVTVEGKNLFDESATSTINGYKDGKYINRFGVEVSESIYAISEYILIPEGANMISMNVPIILYSPSICFYGNDKTYISGANYSNRSVVTEFIPVGAKYLRFTVVKQYADTTMLNEGTTPLPYEPYHTPVTTPIYLPEPIKMVGDEAEYVDYSEQKMHRIGADDIDVTLPALPTIKGTNTMSIDTTVQPSRMDIKGRIKTLT